MNGVQELCGHNLLPVVPKALLNLTEEKNDARVLSATLATSLPTLGTAEEWAEIPRKPPEQREGWLKSPAWGRALLLAKLSEHSWQNKHT